MIKNIIFVIGGVLLEYNPKTYLDKLNIEESIFIDDTNKNIVKANEIGFKTILFNDIEQVKDILKIN